MSDVKEVREPEVLYGKKKFTVQEYLEFEKTSIERHEYYRGEIFRMQGHGKLFAMQGSGPRQNFIFSYRVCLGSS